MGFVFYDLETTGISPAFDQPLQFAAIRTDDSFVEIERVNLRCRIAPHIIPSPQALIVTGVILHNRDKQNVMATLETFRPVELVLRFGGGPPRAYVGCFCGTAAGNPTSAAFFDLEAADPEALIEADDAALFQAVDGTPQIIRSVATNKVPFVFPIANPNPDHLRKAALIAANPAFRARVGEAMAARYVEDPAEPHQFI